MIAMSLCACGNVEDTLDEFQSQVNSDSQFVTGKNIDENIQDVIDGISEIILKEDEYVTRVKNSLIDDVANITYEQAFEGFFAEPKWRYFVGTKEGSDEDGDGKPDYIEENVDIVEFTGLCTYQDVEVTALIQFTVNREEETFSATYLSFNEVPQNLFTLAALMENVCSVNETLSEDIYTDYLYGGGETIAPNELEQMYVGDWYDTYSERCYMTISKNISDYNVDIYWANSSEETCHWSFVAQYCYEWGWLTYTGSYMIEYYPNEGEPQITYVYTDGTGTISIGDDGMLYWYDDVEGAGNNCCFMKNEMTEIDNEEVNNQAILEIETLASDVFRSFAKQVNEGQWMDALRETYYLSDTDRTVEEYIAQNSEQDPYDTLSVYFSSLNLNAISMHIQDENTVLVNANIFGELAEFWALYFTCASVDMYDSYSTEDIASSYFEILEIVCAVDTSFNQDVELTIVNTENGWKLVFDSYLANQLVKPMSEQLEKMEILFLSNLY